jgi:hypothetical protein
MTMRAAMTMKRRVQQTKRSRFAALDMLVLAVAAVAALAAVSAEAAPPDGQIFFARDGVLDARADPAFCQTLRDQTGVDVSHLTLCNLQSPKCQQIDGSTIQGLAVLTCPDRVAQVTAPSASTSVAAPAETSVTLDAVTISTNLRYTPKGAASPVNAIYCKTFGGAASGLRACRKVEAGAGLCADDNPIVNVQLSPAQCAALETVLRNVGARNPTVNFAILENFRDVGASGQTAVGVCGTGVGVQCLPPDALEADGVDYKDIISSQWNQTRTCTYITLDGTRIRRC